MVGRASHEEQKHEANEAAITGSSGSASNVKTYHIHPQGAFRSGWVGFAVEAATPQNAVKAPGPRRPAWWGYITRWAPILKQHMLHLFVPSHHNNNWGMSWFHSNLNQIGRISSFHLPLPGPRGRRPPPQFQAGLPHCLIQGVR